MRFFKREDGIYESGVRTYSTKDNCYYPRFLIKKVKTGHWYASEWDGETAIQGRPFKNLGLAKQWAENIFYREEEQI